MSKELLQKVSYIYDEYCIILEIYLVIKSIKIYTIQIRDNESFTILICLMINNKLSRPNIPT